MALTIELQRAHTPEDVEHVAPCAFCSEHLRPGVVWAYATHDGCDLGVLCRSCVAALGAYRPDLFPTIEEYEAASRHFSGPIWGSIDEAERAFQEGKPWHDAVRANTIRR